jgi:hypothetical protein
VLPALLAGKNGEDARGSDEPLKLVTGLHDRN